MTGTAAAAACGRARLLAVPVVALVLGACLATPQPGATPLTDPTIPSPPPAPTEVTTIPAPLDVEPPTPEAPTSDTYLTASYGMQDERLIGAYAVRRWHDDAPDASPFGDIVTIAAAGQPMVKIEEVTAVDELTGQDISGDGHPDAIVETFSGGAHCCSSVVIYDLGPTMAKLLETPVSNCGGRFEDLDGDGVLEVVSCDDSFAYTYCSYAASPMVKVIYAMAPGEGYKPASPRFADAYAQDIAEHATLAEAAEPGGLSEWDNTTKCAVLPMVLDYLYSGRSDAAWEAFDRLYHAPDAAEFRADIEKTVSESERYVER